MSQHMQKSTTTTTTTTTYISTYQHNSTQSVLTIYTCISYLFQQLEYYLCKLDFIIKAFKTYIFNFLSLETLVQSKSSFSEVSKYRAYKYYNVI